MEEITKLASPLARAESKNAPSDAAISRILILPDSKTQRMREKKSLRLILAKFSADFPEDPALKRENSA
jgi:hypothetical protein